LLFQPPLIFFATRLLRHFADAAATCHACCATPPIDMICWRCYAFDADATLLILRFEIHAAMRFELLLRQPRFAIIFAFTLMLLLIDAAAIFASTRPFAD